MFEKSIEYSHEFNIKILNHIRTLSRNELFDRNFTNQQHDDIVEFELRTNHVGGGFILLYFQSKINFFVFFFFV